MFHRNRLSFHIFEVPFDFFKRVFFLVILCCFSVNCVAQYSISGNNNSKIKYRQIKTDRFHIVYPNYYEPNAQLLASILDTLTPIIGRSLNTQGGRIPILIHTKSSISNGLNVWAPKRIEFWTTPPPTTYSYPYLWQLAIHESRHAAQMQAVNVGITKVLSNIFGEHILGAVAGIWVPNWFFEGDAVVAETALAPAGRGQEPEYNMYLKAQVLDKGRYSVDKMLLGSMKDFVPNHYNLGYFLVSYAREEYGTDIWGECLQEVGRNWWKLRSFGQLKEHYSLNFKNMYNAAIDSLEKVWADNDIDYMRNYSTSPLKIWGEKYKDNYVNYLNPIQIDDSTVIALKSSNYEVQTLVKINHNREEKLLSLPYLLHSYFDYKDGKVIYSQYSPDVRWQQEASADIIEYDMKNKTLRNLTSHQTYFTPTYTNKDDICAIITDSLDNQSINIMHSTARAKKNRNIIEKDKSEVIFTIADSQKGALSYPVWRNDKEIIAIRTTIKGKSIVKYNVEEKTEDVVLQDTYDNIKYLKIYNNRLYFVKDINNKNQVVSINLEDYSDGAIHTNARYGVDNFCIWDSTIVFSDYSADGYRIISMKYRAERIDINENTKDMYFTRLNRQTENFLLSDKTVDTTKVYRSEKYLKRTHLFNVHSWAPVFINIDARELGVGASVFSQNLLSSSVVVMGFKYNFYDKNEVYMKYNFSAWYPIINITSSYKPRDIRRDLDSNKVKYLNWDEVNAGVDISVPLSWVNRNFTNSIKFTLYHKIHSISNSDSNMRLTLFNSLGYQIRLYNYSAMAENDLYPKYGHITNFKFTHTLTSNYSEIFSFSSQIFLPGIARSHSLMFNLSFQKNTPEVYYFPNEISFVRGVYNMYPKYFFGLLSTYNFPFAYPDDGVQGVFYIKRIVARPFYNIGSFDKEVYQSYGTDLELKVHVFRVTVPLDLGFRIGYCKTTENTFASLIFNIDI